MDWDRVNIWTNTLYTLIHSLHTSKENAFFNLDRLNIEINNSRSWIQPVKSYNSVLFSNRDNNKPVKFRRNPNDHFEEIVFQIIKMLVQDLTVILDQMMDELLISNGLTAGLFPQSKIEKLQKDINQKYIWSVYGCYELIATRNVLTHNGGCWNKKSIDIVKKFINPPPLNGEKLVIGIPMLFKYRKAIRTFLNEAEKTLNTKKT